MSDTRRQTRHAGDTRAVKRLLRPSCVKCGAGWVEPCKCPGLLTIEPKLPPTAADFANREADERMSWMLA